MLGTLRKGSRGAKLSFINLCRVVVRCFLWVKALDLQSSPPSVPSCRLPPCGDRSLLRCVRSQVGLSFEQGLLGGHEGVCHAAPNPGIPVASVISLKNGKRPA